MPKQRMINSTHQQSRMYSRSELKDLDILPKGNLSCRLRQIVTFPPPYPTDRDGPNEGVRVGYPDVSRRRVPQLKPLLIPTDSTQVRPRMVVRGLRYKSILLSTGQLTTGAFTI